MRTSLPRIIRAHLLALVLPCAVLGGCASSGEGPGADPALATRPITDDSVERDRLEELYWARLLESRSRFSEADVRFMSGMIPHHAQALVMAALVPDRASDASVMTLAARILSSQEDEITLMQRWLRDRGRDVPEFHIEEARLIHHGTHDHSAMPGMLTDAQLEELERARGAEFDRLFLVYMIQHHRGAVSMVHELFDTDGAGQDPEVFRFASDVQVDQSTEVARMERMLQELSLRQDAR